MYSAPCSFRRPAQKNLTVRLVIGIVVAIAAVLPANGGQQLRSKAAAPAWIASTPMQFEANAGQAAQPTKYLSRGPGYTLFLSPAEAVFSLSGKKSHGRAALHMALVGANPNPAMEELDELPGTANYFLGNDASRWHTSIRTFGKIKYDAVYPGVDLVYYGNQRQLEYDFIVAPGANPHEIAFQFGGAERLELDDQGELITHLSGGDVRWHKPVVYQNTAAGRTEIPASFVVQDSRTVGFQIADYDKSLPLVIDPVLIYSTYLGGSGDDFLGGITVDNAGNVYVIGDTSSLNIPTTNAYDSTPNGSNDVFITKINASGSNIVFSTYLGGSGDDYSGGIAVDSSGNVYVTGQTYSSNFPMKNAFQGSRAGFGDAFVSKLGPNGTNLLYSTYYGGPDDDGGTCIAVDDTGRAYIGGFTWSGRNFPVSSTRFQSKAGGYPNDNNEDAFIVKLNTTVSSGSRVYASYLGGSTDETAEGIVVDASGNAYLAGIVADNYTPYGTPPSSDFPTLNAFQSSFNQGSTNIDAGVNDGFITKINPNGSAMVFSTFFGGSDDDYIWDIAIDSSNRVYVVGESSSIDLPITNAAQPVLAGDINNFANPDAFVAKLQNNGTNLLYSTYLGGSGYESASSLYHFSIAVDKFGLVYVTGQTASFDFPLTIGADMTNAVGTADAFITKINTTVPGPASLIYSTLWGGSADIYAGGAVNYGMAVAVDTNGNFFVGGMTSATNFPVTVGAARMTNSGGYSDTFIAKFSSPPDLSIAMSPSIEPVLVGSNLTYSIQINNNGWSTFHGVTNTVQLPPNAQIVSVSSTFGTWTTNNGVLRFNVGTLTNNAVVTQTVVIAPFNLVSLTNTATLTATETEPNTANNIDTEISTVRGIADIVVTNFATPSTVLATSNFTYTVALTNRGPWPATSLAVTDTLPSAVTFLSAVTTKGAVSTNGNALTWNVGTLGAGSNALLTITAKASATGGNFTSSAGASFYEADFATSNNTANATVTIAPLSDLTLTQTAPSVAYLSNNITYTVVVTNRGPSTATGVMLTNWVPAIASYVSAASTQGTPTQAGGVVTCSVGSLASNATATLTVTVKPTVTGTMTNKAATLPGDTDPALTNNTVSLLTTVLPYADLAVAQTASPASKIVGSNVTFTVNVTNMGPSAASGVTLVDTLPSSFSLVSASSTVDGYLASGGTITFNLGTLANGAVATATIVVTPSLDGIFNNIATGSATTLELNTNNNISNLAVTVIDNTNSPLLRISLAGTNAIVMWSTNATGFTLLQTTNLLPPNWNAITNAPGIVSNRFAVTNKLNSSGSFFRLIK